MDTINRDNNNMTPPWFRLFNIEYISTLLGVSFAIGVAYSTLSGDISKVELTVEKVEQTQSEITKVINRVEIDLSVIRNEQLHLKNQIKEQKTYMKTVISLLEHNRYDRQ